MELHTLPGDAVGPDLVAQATHLVEQARAVDGTSFSEDLWQRFREGRARAVSVVAQGSPDSPEVLAGLAFVAEQGDRLAAELLVHPDHRRRGHGTDLLRSLDPASTGRDETRDLWVWAHGDHPGAARLASTFGLERARELLQLRRPLPVSAGSGSSDPDLALPEPVLPDGVRVRTFVVGQDETAWTAVNAAAFSWHPEQGAMTVEDLRRAEEEPWFDPAGFFLAVDTDDVLLGYHWTKVHRDAGAEPIGEIYVLGVHPDAGGRGIGAALSAVGLRHLAEVARTPTAMLYVEGDNAPALAIYRRQGFTAHAIDVSYRWPAP